MDPAPDAAAPRPLLLRAAGLLVLALVLLGAVRAAALGGEYYDAYETRMAGRLLLGRAEGSFPLYRPPLLVLASAACEALGAGWRGPALLVCASYGLLAGSCALLARRLGARPELALAAAALALLDRLAWCYAPHDLPDVPAAAAAALVLALALPRSSGERALPRPVALGLAIGAAALLRPNAGLVGLALLPAVRARELGPDGTGAWRWPLARLALAGAVGLALYLACSTLTWAWARGDLAGGLAAHGELLRFQQAQLAENHARYGALAPAWFSLHTLAVSSPALLALLPAGLWLGLRVRATGPRLLLAWLAIHVAFTEWGAGHHEARYLLPALPALVGFAALALEGLARAGRARGGQAARLALAAPWAAMVLEVVLAGPYEAARALDPATRGCFAADVARAIAAAAPPPARVLCTTTHPYPVAPAVLRAPGTPYPGDPFHGIYHLGPVVLAWHLGRPVAAVDPAHLPPDRRGGLREPGDLGPFLRAASGLRPGDLLVVGITGSSTTADLRGAPTPPLLLLRVVPGPGLEPVAALSPSPAPQDRR